MTAIRFKAGVFAGFVLLITAVTSSAQAAHSSMDDKEFGDAVTGRTEGSQVEAGVSEFSGPSTRNRPVGTEPRDRRVRREICQDWIVSIGGSEPTRSFVFEGEIPACVEPFDIVEDFCPDGEQPLAPLWESRLEDPVGPTYGPWMTITGYQCAEDPLPTAVAEAWRQMVIEPQAIEVLPDNGWATAVMGVKAELDDSPQTSTVTVLGTSVVLRATPTDQQWSVTDVVTGESWPGVFETASHGEEVILFDRKEHRVQLGLTTSWEGHYSLNGGSTWVSAPGTATTTSDPYSVHVYNPRARLVNCNTTGDCVGSGGSSNPFTLTDPDADGIDNYEIPDDQIGSYLAKRAKPHN